jgi:acyl dehydratase
MAADMVDDELDHRLRSLVGRVLGASSGSLGPDPVNQPMIRHWAAAFEDDNPVYTDPVAAAGSRFGGVVAPPLMLQTWTMPTPTITGMAERGGSPTEQSGESPITIFDEAGFTGTVASNSEFEFERYLRPGDTVSSTTQIESISERKETRLGPGYFVTWMTTYSDAEGAVVGRQRFRILKFNPSGATS